MRGATSAVDQESFHHPTVELGLRMSAPFTEILIWICQSQLREKEYAGPLSRTCESHQVFCSP
jgi:hypothetical protein